jgi:hypothetical protein
MFTVFPRSQNLGTYAAVLPGLPVIDGTYFRRSLFLVILSWKFKGLCSGKVLKVSETRLILGKDVQGNVPGSQGFFERLRLVSVVGKANMPETRARHCILFFS